jgi:hypothetical protein
MNHTSVVGYDNLSGKILAVATFNTGSFRDVDRNVYEREGFDTIVVEEHIEFSRKDIYVKDGAIAERPTFTTTISPGSITADGVSMVTISGFPADSTLTISGPINETWTETETTTELTVNLPGSYKVRIENWPYQDAEVTFNAT